MEANAATAALEGRHTALLDEASNMGTEELLDVIEAAQKEKDAASARQAVALAHLSAREPHLQEDGTTVEVNHGLGHQRMDAPELAAPRMGVSVHVATRRVSQAIDQLTRTPAVVDAMACGDLDEQRAAAVTEETEFLSSESAAAVVDLVRARWSGLTTGPLRRLLARAAAIVDPEAVAAHSDDERSRRGLTRRTGVHGTDAWRGEFLVEQSRAAWAAVTELARRKVRDGSAPTLEVARADALMELVLEHSDVRVVVHTTRAANTSPDDRGSRGGLVEVGAMDAPGTTFVPRDWVEDHLTTDANGTTSDSATTTSTTTHPAPDTDRADEGAATEKAASDKAWPHNPDTVLGDAPRPRELACHPDTGALLSGDVPASLASSRSRRTSDDKCAAYRVPAGMARLVRLRDGSCRFPGCSTSARQCDLDHVRPWPTGSTSPTNLIALCRHHHRIKQRPGWSVYLHHDGRVTWRDPTGRAITTWPVDHLHLVTATHASASHTNTTTCAPEQSTAAPSRFEDELTALLEDEAVPLGRSTRPTVWNAEGRLVSGPPSRADLHSGRIRHQRTRRHTTVNVEIPHRPTPRPASPDAIPF